MTVPISAEIKYPTSDGRPMAETDLHRDLINYLIHLLQHYYQEQPDVYVSGNLLVFYEKNNPRKQLFPDCFVVFGVPKKLRLHYKIWEEGLPPRVVFELTSATTADKDRYEKFLIYDQLWQVEELFLFDPTADYIDPRKQAHRRLDGRLQPFQPIGGLFQSQVLGLSFTYHDCELIVVETATDKQVLSAQQRYFQTSATLDQIEAALEEQREARESAELAQEAERLTKEAERRAKEQAVFAQEGERLAKPKPKPSDKPNKRPKRNSPSCEPNWKPFANRNRPRDHD